MLFRSIRLAPAELSFILNDAEAKVLIYDAEFTPLLNAFRGQLRSVQHFLTLEDYDRMLAEREPYFIDFTEMDENSVAELFYTSGTTSSPKGVMLTHRNLYLHALNVIAGLSVGTRDTSVEMHTIPLFHANGWGRAHSLVAAGGKHVMIRRFDPRSEERRVGKECRL